MSPVALVTQAPEKLESRTGAVSYSQTMALEEASLLTKWHCSGMSARVTRARAAVEAIVDELKIETRSMGEEYQELRSQRCCHCEGTPRNGKRAIIVDVLNCVLSGWSGW